MPTGIELVTIPREDYQKLTETVGDLKQAQEDQDRINAEAEARFDDLLKATGLDRNPRTRRAQLSVATWVSSKTGWWSGALSITQLSKEALGPFLTSAWSNPNNLLYQTLSGTAQNIYPDLVPIIQGGAPFVIGFALGGDLGSAIGKFIGTQAALHCPEGNIINLPANMVIPGWVQALSPRRLARRALTLTTSVTSNL
ncbi:hypothetical protein HYW44_02810 [Candidatus Daviesbacteria bacterium]|nr:hypothetical protein [Candidatus Daviesbacteria bacterium]